MDGTQPLSMACQGFPAAAAWRELAGHATISRIRDRTGTLRYLTKSVPWGGEPEMGGVLIRPPRPMNA